MFFDYKSSFWIWLPVNTVSVVATTSIALLIVGMDGFNWCSLYQISCLFRVVAMKLSHLDEVRDDEQFRKQLAEIHHLQETAYRFVESSVSYFT